MMKSTGRRYKKNSFFLSHISLDCCYCCCCCYPRRFLLFRFDKCIHYVVQKKKGSKLAEGKDGAKGKGNKEEGGSGSDDDDDVVIDLSKVKGNKNKNKAAPFDMKNILGYLNQGENL